MKLILNIMVFLLIFQLGNSQELVCSLQDKNAFESKIIEIDGFLEKEYGKTVTSVGKTFLGTPYVAKTLEIDENEPLVINFQGLDCTTFVENVLVFSNLLKNGKTDFSDFTQTLENLRYIDGIRNGYASRLHYFSEWIVNNQKKGWLKDITSEIGGIEINKTINFMSMHRNLYPFLKDNDINYEKIKASEEFLNNESICVLEQDKIEANEHLIKSGDIIALATSIKGLDVTHTGIAIREKDGRIHILHASSSGKVKISKEPLIDYLRKIKNNTGIMVCRPL